jgi:hypothetical protein
MNATVAGTAQPNVDLHASLVAAIGIEANARALLDHAKANVTAIRKQIAIADAAAPKPKAEPQPPNPAADLSFIDDNRDYPDVFIAKLFGISTKTVQRHFGPAVKDRKTERNNRKGAAIKEFARKRRLKHNL